jgi:hypothetical protein
MNWIWPKIYNRTTAMAAAKEGAWAAFLIAGITGAVALLSVFGLSALASPWSLVDAAVAAFLGIMMRRMSRLAAVAMLVLFFGSRVYAMAQGISSGTGVMSVALLLLFVSAVRGTFAYHRF